MTASTTKAMATMGMNPNRRSSHIVKKGASLSGASTAFDSFTTSVTCSDCHATELKVAHETVSLGTPEEPVTKVPP